MAVGEGEANVPAANGLASPQIEYGEFRNAQWHTVSRSHAPAGDVHLSMRATLRSGIAVVCGREDAGETGEAMESLLAR
jgi:hypothetical protein